MARPVYLQQRTSFVTAATAVECHRSKPLARCYSITSSARASRFRRNFQAEHARGLRIDDKLELGRLLDRQVGRLGSLSGRANSTPSRAAAFPPAAAPAPRAATHQRLACPLQYASMKCNASPSRLISAPVRPCGAVVRSGGLSIVIEPAAEAGGGRQSVPV